MSNSANNEFKIFQVAILMNYINTVEKSCKGNFLISNIFNVTRWVSPLGLDFSKRNYICGRE